MISQYDKARLMIKLSQADRRIKRTVDSRQLNDQQENYLTEAVCLLEDVSDFISRMPEDNKTTLSK